MKRLFSFLLCSFLGGCTSFTSERISCPKTAILAEFSKSLNFFKGIPIRTEMDSLTPECAPDGNQIIMNFRLRMTSLRPLSHFHHAFSFTPSYFVAVVDKAGNVLSRSDHDLKVNFEEKQTTKVDFVRLQERMPANKEVSVYVGFNLDEKQLDFLRKEREKKLHDHRSQSH